MLILSTLGQRTRRYWYCKTTGTTALIAIIWLALSHMRDRHLISSVC